MRAATPFAQRRLAVRAVADGREAAESIRQYLSRRTGRWVMRPFNSRMGKLQMGDGRSSFGRYGRREAGSLGDADGFIVEESVLEGRRCLHCDCRKPDDCL